MIQSRACSVALVSVGLCMLLAVTAVYSQTITLVTGEFYFRYDGIPSFPLGTNPTGWKISQFDTLLAYAGENENIVRIHITNGRRPSQATVAGEVDEAWAGFWDGVFTMADQNGLRVLPVFDVWADWNTTNTGAQSWANNPYNVINGGPAVDPSELLMDTPTRELWMGWVKTLIVRWEDRSNILGWEVFSELDLISGSTDSAAVAFVEAAADTIRATDSQGRPVTASLAGINDWPALSNSSIDFIQVHPYADATGNLHGLILSVVRERRTEYGKPVFIGESGLDSRAPVDFSTLALAARASVGINHAIWASAVSGAMVGRMLWFEDGHDQYHQNADGTTLDLRTHYKDVSAPVARFVAGVDYSGFEPIDVGFGSDLTGAAIGNAALVLAWVRDVQSAAPDWPDRLLSGKSVAVPGQGQSEWQVTFYDTMTGDVLESATPTRRPTVTSMSCCQTFPDRSPFRFNHVTRQTSTETVRSVLETSSSLQPASAKVWETMAMWQPTISTGTIRSIFRISSFSRRPSDRDVTDASRCTKIYPNDGGAF